MNGFWRGCRPRAPIQIRPIGRRWPAIEPRNESCLAHDVLKSYDLAHLVLKALDQRLASNLAGRYLERIAKPHARAAG